MAKTQENLTDEELSDLLDNALSDFNTATTVEKAEPPTSSNQVQDSSNKLSTENLDELNGELFHVLQSDEFRQFAKTISETVQGLNVSDDNEPVDSALNNPEFLNRMLDQNGASLMPMMQGMMQNLLSKDVLYPSIKEISDKFPQWLAENSAKLTGENIAAYRGQHRLMLKICEELEQEQSGDADSVKKARFERVLSLMQQMQEFGDPPGELMQACSGDNPVFPPAIYILHVFFNF